MVRNWPFGRPNFLRFVDSFRLEISTGMLKHETDSVKFQSSSRAFTERRNLPAQGFEVSVPILLEVPNFGQLERICSLHVKITYSIDEWECVEGSTPSATWCTRLHWAESTPESCCSGSSYPVLPVLITTRCLQSVHAQSSRGSA